MGRGACGDPCRDVSVKEETRDYNRTVSKRAKRSLKHLPTGVPPSGLVQDQPLDDGANAGAHVVLLAFRDVGRDDPFEVALEPVIVP